MLVCASRPARAIDGCNQGIQHPAFLALCHLVLQVSEISCLCATMSILVGLSGHAEGPTSGLGAFLDLRELYRIIVGGPLRYVSGGRRAPHIRKSVFPVFDRFGYSDSACHASSCLGLSRLFRVVSACMFVFVYTVCFFSLRVGAIAFSLCTGTQAPRTVVRDMLVCYCPGDQGRRK